MLSIKDMIKDNKKVTFQFYREHELWYATEDGFLFPVPIEDVGNATFLSEDKALIMMRYIRKHVDYLDKAKQEHASTQGSDASQ